MIAWCMTRRRSPPPPPPRTNSTLLKLASVQVWRGLSSSTQRSLTRLVFTAYLPSLNASDELSLTILVTKPSHSCLYRFASLTHSLTPDWWIDEPSLDNVNCHNLSHFTQSLSHPANEMSLKPNLKLSFLFFYRFSSLESSYELILKLKPNLQWPRLTSIKPNVNKPNVFSPNQINAFPHSSYDE